MSAPTPVAAGPGAARRRVRRRALLAGAAGAVLATTSVAAFTRYAPAAQSTVDPPRRPPATATVLRTDLVDRIKVDGELGYGPSRPLAARRQGTITWLPKVGAVITRGKALYAVDATGVPLLIGAIPMYRELRRGVADGPDVAMLQRNLAKLGHRAAGDAKGRFGWATEHALKHWQRDRKVKPTGRLAPGDVVVLPQPVRVAAVSAQLGAPAEGELMRVTGVRRLVSAELKPAQRGYARAGAGVEVELPDGRLAAGVIREVLSDDAAGGSEDKEATLRITVSLRGGEKASETGRVAVILSGERKRDVLAVPVRALLALTGGRYAVQVLRERGRRQLVEVRLGMFADGLVEIRASGLAPGMRVVIAP